MSLHGEPPPDRLYAALDLLVRSQALSAAQADQVYRALTGLPQSASRPPPSPPSAAPSAAGAPAATAAAPQAATAWSRTAFGAAIGVLGAGLMSGAFLVSYNLAEQDLSWKTLAGMVVPIAALTAVVAVSRVRTLGGCSMNLLASTAGAGALVAVALAVSAIGGSSALAYASGFIMLVGGGAGYAVFRRQAFVWPVVLGGLVLVGRAGAHLIDGTTSSGESGVLFYGVLLLLYGVAVGGVGWRLPCRHLAGVLGGSIAVGSMVLVILVNGFTGAFFLGPTGDVQVSYRSDTVIALVLGLVVCSALAAAYAARQEAGFMAVSWTGGSVLPTLAVPFLTQKHPLQLAAVFVFLAASAFSAGVALTRAKRPAAPSDDASLASA